MIYLGTGFAPSGWNTGHGSFAFDQKIFPDPELMFHQMHDEDFRVVLHVLGAPHDLMVASRITLPIRTMPRTTGAITSRPSPPASTDGGSTMATNSSPRPASRATACTGKAHSSSARHARPFSIQRNGYAGLQQYGFLWSGDVNSAWQTLRVQIANGLNTALSGIPYWGTDTGGFFSTKELTAELYVPLVSVQRILSTLSLARPYLDAAPPLGLGSRRSRPRRR